MQTIDTNAENIYGETQDLVSSLALADGTLDIQNLNFVSTNLEQAAASQIEGLKQIVPPEAANQVTAGIKDATTVATKQSEGILHNIQSLTPE